VANALKVGTRVRVPWGLEEDREAVVVEVWGDPAHPSQVRVELLSDDQEDEPVVLLLSPSVLIPVPAA
jgi:primosomal protein N'